MAKDGGGDCGGGTDLCGGDGGGIAIGCDGSGGGAVDPGGERKHVMKGSGNMAERWLTITEIAQELGIPETTARRYARILADYIRSKTIGRTTRYPGETVQLFAQIAELFRQGYTSHDVREWLQREAPKTIVVDEEADNDDHHHSPPPVEAVAMLVEAQNKLINELKDEVAQLRKELEAARQEIAATKQEIAATVVRGVEEVKETLSRVEKRKQEEQAKPWWRRIFR